MKFKINTAKRVVVPENPKIKFLHLNGLIVILRMDF